MKKIAPEVKSYLSTYHRNTSSTNSLELPESNLTVKNKSPAPIQITVEQILKEAYSGYKNDTGRKDFSRIHESFEFKDRDELDDYRIKKRKDFEDSIRRKRWKISLYLSYAKWESLQSNINNSRSIFERALNINYEHTRIWREYINMEIINGNINNARNLYERVTKLLPKIEEFWLKYVQMEQILKNYINVRYIYKNWLKWKPAFKVYIQYSRFEEECGEIEMARNVMHDLIYLYPEEQTYIAFAKFEQKHNNLLGVVNVFELMINNYREKIFNITPRIFVFFAETFIKEKKFNEAIRVYNQGIILFQETHKIHFLKEKLFLIYKMTSKERVDENPEWIKTKTEQYQNRLLSHPENFDLWFDYSVFAFQYLETKLVQKIVDILLPQFSSISDVLEWEKYFYSLLLCACFFETNVDESESMINSIFNELIKKVEKVVRSNCMNSSNKIKDKEDLRDPIEFLDSRIQYEKFPIFSEIFIFYSNYQLRRGNINFVRKILGNGLGRVPCSKLFEYYIDLEVKLGNFDRCRILFTKYIEQDPVSANTWIQYIQFEYKLREINRVISIAEAAISMPELDSPEIIWQYYIDIMIEEGDLKSADNIYKRLLDKTQHFQVVMNYSMFIISKLNDVSLNRNFILKMLNLYKQNSMNYERSIIIKYWLHLEEKLSIEGNYDEAESWVTVINKLLPTTIVSKENKQYIFDEENYDIEYLRNLKYRQIDEDTHINDEVSKVPVSLVDAAKRWKKIKFK